MALANLNRDIKDGPKKGTEVRVDVDDFSSAEDDDLISVSLVSNDDETYFIPRKNITINPDVLQVKDDSAKDKTDKDKKEDDSDPLADLDL